MTNNLKEILDKIHDRIKLAYEMTLASNDSDQKKGIDNFYHIHLNPLEYQIDTWLRTLINQKGKEARLEENKRYEEWFNNDDSTHIEDFIEDRIKQLKEELNKEVV